MQRTFRIAAGIAVLLMASAVTSFGQAEKRSETAKPSANPAASSPAYAELLLIRTELLSQLESLILEYTEEFPKVKEIRYVLSLFDRDFATLGNVKPSDTAKLTIALGKLMARRIEVETDLWNLRRNYKDEHPDVKRARRRVEIFENAIGQVLN